MTLAKVRRWYTAFAVFVLNTLAVFVAANAVALVVLALRKAPAPGPMAPAHVSEALRRLLPGLDEAELGRLATENVRQYVYEPFTQFREAPFAGKYVNVDRHGFRRSKNQAAWPPEPKAFNVFLFGGSTTFNYGVPDDETIASHLQDRLAAAGVDARVYNFGRGAYYSTRERILFEQLLLAGYVPKIAIFVDGLNDFVFFNMDPVAPDQDSEAAVLDGAEARPWTTAVAGLPLTRALDLLGWRFAVPKEQPRPPVPAAPAQKRPAFDDPTVSRKVAARYLANKKLIESAAAAFGVQPVLVWQPVPTYKYDLRFHIHQGSFGGHEYSRFGYPWMAEYVRSNPLGPNFLWCADIQEGVEELLYVDQVHYSPGMSDRLAGCIVDLLRARGFLS